MQDNISEKIKDISKYLKSKQDKKIDRNKLRQLLSRKIGSIISVNNKNTSCLNILGNKGLIGVDGSLMSLGTNYPYEITLFRSYSKCTTHQDVISESRVFCPLYDKDRQLLEDMVQDSKGSLTEETAAHKLKKDMLASLELMTAIQAIKHFNSKMILMDGGFYRFIISAPNLWEEFKHLCLSTHTLVAGVIEEIGTHSISDILHNDLPHCMHKSYDREILFGVLNAGECLMVDKSINIKNGFYTCFARFAAHPQPIAIDLFNEQIENFNDIINIIACLTPSNSRGIPLWIDIVDRQVRITKKEMEILLDTMFDSDIKEIYFMANRHKRQY